MPDMTLCINFNPHSHEGSDYIVQFIKYGVKVISIHTPTKGATGLTPNAPAICKAISIHTPTKGATSTHRCELPHLLYFNPHSHEGSDHDPEPYIFTTIPDFNPHSHEGSDTILLYLIQGRDQISIHTPTKGATAILTNNFLIFCSISLINFILYLQIIQILFIFRYKFIFYFIF